MQLHWEWGAELYWGQDTWLHWHWDTGLYWG